MALSRGAWLAVVVVLHEYGQPWRLRDAQLIWDPRYVLLVVVRHALQERNRLGEEGTQLGEPCQLFPVLAVQSVVNCQHFSVFDVQCVVNLEVSWQVAEKDAHQMIVLCSDHLIVQVETVFERSLFDKYVK